FWGLDEEKLSYAKPTAYVMHPGPMNRGVEIESGIADHKTRSLITEQVEMGVAVRMAVLETLARNAPEIGAPKAAGEARRPDAQPSTTPACPTRRRDGARRVGSSSKSAEARAGARQARGQP